MVKHLVVSCVFVYVYPFLYISKKHESKIESNIRLYCNIRFIILTCLCVIILIINYNHNNYIINNSNQLY